MIRCKKTLFGAAFGAVVMSLAVPGAAAGLALEPSELPAEVRGDLEQQIASFRAESPDAFTGLAAVRGHRPETYRQFRNPVPMVSRELFHLGRDAVLPMIEALAFVAPDTRGLSQAEQDVLTVGMLDTLGRHRDGRAAAVLHGIFGANRSAAATAAAGEAMGRLCDGSSVELLRAALADPSRRVAAIRGLGQCRGLEAAQVLAAELDAVTTPEEAATIARALGALGSSWAWQALGPARAAEGLAARRIAAAALVRGYVRFPDAGSRAPARTALRMVEHPDLGAIVAEHAKGADATARQELAALVR